MGRHRPALQGRLLADARGRSRVDSVKTVRQFLASWARRFLPLLAVPILLLIVLPLPVWIKVVAVLIGVFFTLLEHFLEWVVIPWRQRRREGAQPIERHQPPPAC